MKMRILLQFSYDGSLFHGFQRQNNVKNVQSDIENALKNIYQEDICIKGAGRTDAKVHAYNQYAHFDVDKYIPFLKCKLNKLLKDIKIKKVTRVTNDLHARYSVKYKEYKYKISFNKQDNPKYYLLVYKNLDVDKMIEASKLFVGTHDFKNFVSGYRDDYTTTIFDVKFNVSSNKLIITFKGIGFYRYMVRNLVGALLDVGYNKVDKDILLSMLKNPNIDKRLSTAKPEGLYLYKIKY